MVQIILLALNVSQELLKEVRDKLNVLLVILENIRLCQALLRALNVILELIKMNLDKHHANHVQMDIIKPYSVNLHVSNVIRYAKNVTGLNIMNATNAGTIFLTWLILQPEETYAHVSKDTFMILRKV